jgi:hypothetical protein
VWFTSAAIVGYVPDYMEKGRIIMSCAAAHGLAGSVIVFINSGQDENSSWLCSRWYHYLLVHCLRCRCWFLFDG